MSRLRTYSKRVGLASLSVRIRRRDACITLNGRVFGQGPSALVSVGASRILHVVESTPLAVPPLFGEDDPTLTGGDGHVPATQWRSGIASQGSLSIRVTTQPPIIRGSKERRSTAMRHGEIPSDR